MLDESISAQRDTRPLRSDEIELITALLQKVRDASFSAGLSGLMVADMNDGGMGSIRFDGPNHRKLGAVVAEAQYVDSDGVLVSIALNLDDRNQLFEVDLWKVDFSPLKRYPKPHEVKF